MVLLVCEMARVTSAARKERPSRSMDGKPLCAVTTVHKREHENMLFLCALGRDVRIGRDYHYCSDWLAAARYILLYLSAHSGSTNGRSLRAIV